MEMKSALVGPNISPHYISIAFAPLHFKCNYICHNFSGFPSWSELVAHIPEARNTNIGSLETERNAFLVNRRIQYSA